MKITFFDRAIEILKSRNLNQKSCLLFELIHGSKYYSCKKYFTKFNVATNLSETWEGKYFYKGKMQVNHS